MNTKLSHVALALLASTSFYAAAETIVPGSAVTAEADIVVSADSSVGLDITPIANLTVADVKRGYSTILAGMRLTGENVALHMVNSDPAFSFCSWVTGSVDNTNKIQVCFDRGTSLPLINFDIGGKIYYPHNPLLDNTIRSGFLNADPASGAKVGADTYKVSVEAIQYTR